MPLMASRRGKQYVMDSPLAFYLTHRIAPHMVPRTRREDSSSAFSSQVESCLFELSRPWRSKSPQTSLPRRRSAVQSGVATGLSTLAVSGSAALAGAYLAHKFGRNAETDDFLAAYGVYSSWSSPLRRSGS